MRNSISEFSVSWIIKKWSIFFFYLFSYFHKYFCDFEGKFSSFSSDDETEKKNTVQTKLKMFNQSCLFFVGVVVTSWTLFLCYVEINIWYFFWCWRSVWEKGTWSFFLFFYLWQNYCVMVTSNKSMNVKI